jgi:hypothetical protein
MADSVQHVSAATLKTRRSSLLVVLVLVVAAVVLLLGWPRTGRAPARDEPTDSDVSVRDFSVQRTDASYLVESVHAVVQGDRAFLRVRISWPDESDDAGTSHAVPALSGTVLHEEPYAGMTATCGVDQAPPDAPSPANVDLVCSGLLVPDRVVLRD